MKTFLNSFSNFVSSLKFHLQQFPPNENFKISPFPLFVSPLDFERFQSPRISLSSKIQFHPLHKGGEPL